MRAVSLCARKVADHLLSFEIQYHGQMALQAGILVAFTQAIPEHQIQVFGFFKARVKVKWNHQSEKWLSLTSDSRFRWHTILSPSLCLLVINRRIFSSNSDGWSLMSG